MDEERIDEQIEFNQWLKKTAAEEDFTTIDTTEIPVTTTVERVDQWISDCLSETKQ